MGKYVAVDLGAESGRVIVGTVGEMEVVHRFSNNPVRVMDSIYWNFLELFSEIKTGLANAFSKYGEEIVSIGVDTWGVDYALLDANGDLIGNPYHYRDDRTDGMVDEVFTKISREEVYEETGIQVMQLNTLYQLYAHAKEKPEIFSAAKRILNVPDLLHYWLTGEMKSEYSHATTTQLYNTKEKRWSKKILNALDLPESIFGDVVPSGTKIGTLLPHVAEEVGAPSGVSVIAPACHDTASAVAAVPATGDVPYAYLSSGTWSLLGVEMDEPLINEKTSSYNFTNEGAADGGVRFLKNIMGLWILQESKRFWDETVKEYSYDELMFMGKDSPPSKFTLDPDYPRFLKPGVIDDSMPDRIKEYCKETGQPVPETIGEISRGIHEGLAGKYATTIKEIEDCTGQTIEELYIIGGGSMSVWLCELTANVTGIPVYAGPKEATAIGNIMIQAIAMGEIKSISEGRKLVKESYGIKRYMPERS